MTWLKKEGGGNLLWKKMQQTFQQHIFIVTITAHARGCVADLTASKDTPQKKTAHVFVDECHPRPRDDFHFALLSNEHCQKHFTAFRHIAYCSRKY